MPSLIHKPGILDVSDIDSAYTPLVEEDAGLLSGIVGHQAGPPLLLPASTPFDELPGLGYVQDAPMAPSGTSGSSGSTALASTATASPSLIQSFAGPNFDSVGAVSGSYMIPPDCTEATGTAALVCATNGEIEVFARGSGGTATTTPLINSSLDKFFAATGITGAFDPKIVYDAASDKFVVAALARNATTHTSNLLIAVSTDGTGTHWNTQALNAAESVNGNASWADFPGLSVDGHGAVYVTTNLFSFGAGSYQGSRLWILDEGLGSAHKYDPSVLSGATAPGASELFSLMPAQMQGSAVPADGGTFLVSYDGASSGGGKVVNIIRVDHPLSGPTFTYEQSAVGAIDSAPAYSGYTAPQSGTTRTIDAGDDRMLNAVWQDGNLYAATTIIPTSGPDQGHATAHWFKIAADFATATASLADQGNVSGAAIGAGDRTFYPDIAVDSAGDFALSFAVSGPNIHPSAYYAVHAAGDAAGTLEQAQLLRAGSDVYYRTFGGGDNRWGDFSSMSVDPLNSGAFWVFNEYAMARGDSIRGETGRWATQIGAFGLPAPVLASAQTSSTTSTTDAGLTTVGLAPELIPTA